MKQFSAQILITVKQQNQFFITIYYVKCSYIVVVAVLLPLISQYKLFSGIMRPTVVMIENSSHSGNENEVKMKKTHGHKIGFIFTIQSIVSCFLFGYEVRYSFKIHPRRNFISHNHKHDLIFKWEQTASIAVDPAIWNKYYFLFIWFSESMYNFHEGHIIK